MPPNKVQNSSHSSDQTIRVASTSKSYQANGNNHSNMYNNTSSASNGKSRNSSHLNTQKTRANGSDRDQNRLAKSQTTKTSIPQAMPEVKEYLFKILVIGELGTGKTSFIKRYVHQYFSECYRATIGVDFALKVLNWDDNTLIRLQLWDIAGQERFGNMTRVYYKEAVGAFLVFDVSAPNTFNAVLKWKHDLDTKVCLADGGPIPCLLLANKCDSTKEGIAANTQLLEKFSTENNFCGWYYTSAKENINVESSAKFLAGKILQRQKHFVMEETAEKNNLINLDYSNHSMSQSLRKCNC